MNNVGVRAWVRIYAKASRALMVAATEIKDILNWGEVLHFCTAIITFHDCFCFRKILLSTPERSNSGAT